MTGDLVKDVIASLEQVVLKISRAECPAVLGELERLKVLTWAKLMDAEATIECPRVSTEMGGI